MYDHTVLHWYSVSQQHIVSYTYVLKKKKFTETITTITKLATIPGLPKTEFIKCPLRMIVITDLFMFELYIFWQYRCNSEFSVFLTFELRFILLSVGSSLSTLLLICVWQNKFIQYCWMLLNSKKSLKCKMVTLKCFSKMAKREL